MDRPLEVLKKRQKQILLAEVGALLHDIGKLSDGFLRSGPEQMLWAKFHHLVLRRLNRKLTQVRDLSTEAIEKSEIAARSLMENGIYDEKTLTEEVHNRANVSRTQAEILLGEALVPDGFLIAQLLEFLEQAKLNLFDEESVVGDLIEEHATPFYSRVNGQRNDRQRVSQILQHADFCDSAADKGAADQSQDQGISVATAYGWERSVQLSQLDQFQNGIVKNLPDRQELLKQICELLENTLGETRRAANDVTLWDHSYSVASLFKSALVGTLLQGWSDPQSLRWRLLHVNFDVLGFYSKAIKIADLLGYQRAIEEACEAVKQLVEEEYPLGNEVYRDTTGIYFTFPDLELPPELAEEIRRRIQGIEPELAPRIKVGQGDKSDKVTEHLKTILAQQRNEALEELARPVSHENYDPHWQEQWKRLPAGKWEICPVCQLRPKLDHNEVCEQCGQRREPRVREWLKEKYSTIWIDEISDRNGRVALLVGRFALDDWLSGDLVQTMLVRAEENDPDACRTKNPSPARLRRIWETTDRFWEAMRDRSIPEIVGECRRLEFSAEFHPQQGQTLQSDQACELNLGSYRLPIFYRDGRQFLTIERLDYALKRLRLKSVQELKEKLDGSEYGLEQSGEYGAKRQRIGKLTGIEIKEEIKYRPLISILAEPPTFMAFVPADRALEIAKEITTKHEREMGKVRNRLPLHLGLVFFPRKTPLRTALEAGRNMLNGFSQMPPDDQEPWEVTAVCEFNEHLPKGLKDDPHFRRGRTIELTRMGRRLCWHVPLTMGDGETEDIWYPYAFIKGDVQDRSLHLQLNDDKASVSESYRDRWLVHAKYLKDGDRIYFNPSYFDFEFLDTNARRFEVSYKDGQRRAPAKRNRPYLLDDLECFKRLWKPIEQDLTTSQIKALDGLIEAKRGEWEQGTGWKEYCGTFERFVCNALKNAGWKAKPQDWAALNHAALSGQLHDVLELYMEALKKKPKRDQQEGEEVS